jgi:WhiB family redox-sensing transcriptional regulator
VSELIMPPAWFSDAPCARVDPDLWHPERGDAIDSRAARRICNGDPQRGTKPCPFREACLEWAVKTDQTYGIWGGQTSHQRRALREGRDAA